MNAKAGTLTYISLFSGGGVGCYGLAVAGFSCVATVENVFRRLDIQKFNNKCLYSTGYICGDMAAATTQDKIVAEVKKWGLAKPEAVDVVIATPPCQGMSVCNHKKNNEKQRNSLVVSALETIVKISPKIFILENTSLFLKTLCGLRDGRELTINDAIEEFLGNKYHIFSRKMNLKNYGCPSSRTRTLIIGTSKKLQFSPISISPDWAPEKTLREVIGDLPPLRKMGEISPDDIYHSFKPYAAHMRSWICDLKEGQGAFEQKSAKKRPHRIVCGQWKENKNANGDKYRRQRWDAPPPCVHTRNDILSSQNTVHPSDDRVFSIREVMRMMSTPPDFQWHRISHKETSQWAESEKRKFLRANEMNIRQCLGEAVPTGVIHQIAVKAVVCLMDNRGTRLCKSRKFKVLPEKKSVCGEITQSGDMLTESLMCEMEMANEKRSEHAAYYTPPIPAFKLMEILPDLRRQKSIRILEPSVGIGRLLHFLPQLAADYNQIIIDAMDIDPVALNIARSLFARMTLPPQVRINYLQGDFLTHSFSNHYDLIISNPPFGKMDVDQFRLYTANAPDTGSRNIFSFFLAKALGLARHVVIVSPKSFLNAPEFGKLRREINAKHTMRSICDFGETGFDGVRIETITMAIETNRGQKQGDLVAVESVPLNFRVQKYARKIFDAWLPYWVIYRDKEFDSMLKKMEMGVFSAFRDRQISKRHQHKTGEVKLVKARNVASLSAQFHGEEIYIRNPEKFAVHRFINRKDVLLIPNLSYNPRACRMPENCVPDGSVAILYPINGLGRLSNDKVRFFASDEFRRFYRIARNFGTRSLNIDSNSVFFFGVRV